MSPNRAARIDELRAFFAQVDDAHIPALRRHIRRMALLLSWPPVVLAPVAFGMGVLISGGSVEPAWLGLLLASGALLATVVRWTWALERPALLATVCLVAILGLSFATGEAAGQLEVMLSIGPLILMFVALFLPVCPKSMLVMGGVLCAYLVSAYVLLLPDWTHHLWFQLGAAWSAAAAAALVSQLQRRAWDDEREQKDQLVASDRLAQVARMSAVLAHEIKTPLAASRHRLSLVKQLIDELRESVGHPDIEPEDLREIAREIRAALAESEAGTQRVAQIVQSTRARAGVQAGVSQEFDLAARADGVRAMLDHQLTDDGVTLELDASLAVRLRLDPGQLDQILLNIVRNAADAIRDAGVGGHIRVAFEHEAGGGRLIIEDDGPGILPEVRDRLFEPGVTSKAAGEGVGLGLWVSRSIAAAFGGDLRTESRPDGGRGARFVWDLAPRTVLSPSNLAEAA